MSLDTNSSKYVTALIKNSSDAMQNLYYVEFTGANLEDISQALKVRLKDFKPPVFTQKKNPVRYLTVGMDMPGAEITGDKTFDLTFRLDSNYKVYEYLLRQQSFTMVANSGWVTTRVPETTSTFSLAGDNSVKAPGFIVNVYAFNRSKGNDPDNDECYSLMYKFKYCWIESLSGLNFSYENSEPMIVQAKINFMDYEDPMNLLS